MSTEITTLGTLGQWGSGGTPLATRSEYYGGTIPWLVIEDLNDGTVERASRTINEVGLANSSAKIIPPGTILVAMYGSIGKLGVTAMSCATNQAIAFCECDLSRVDPEYLFYWLLNERRTFLYAGRGGTQQNISQEFLKAYPIRLPDLGQQRRIADRLAKAGRLRKASGFATELSAALLSAAFMEMFGDPRTNLRGWDSCSIDEVVELSQYGTSLKSNAQGRGYPVLGMANITNDGTLDLTNLGHVELSEADFKRLRLQPDDIIFNRTNSAELVGKTAHWPGGIDAVVASYLVRLRLRPFVNPIFFAALLNTRYFKRLFQERCRKAVGQSNISPTLLREFRIFVPTLRLQDQFANLASHHLQLHAAARETWRQSGYLFDSLLRAAFAEGRLQET